jgi:uncharacterized protein YecE (DUF72 family)
LPAARWFEHSASVFDTVELNATFYRLPSEPAVKSWREKAPDGFVFAAKASRLITHFRRLRNADSALRTYLQRIEGLEEHLGPLLFQLPPDFEPGLDRLEAFLKLLPSKHRYAFEFRNRGWWTEATFGLLSEHEIAFCAYNMGDTSTAVIATAPFVYVRFHGPAGYDTPYSDDQLSHWAKRLQALSGVEDAFVYFNNDLGGHAPRDALRFREIVTK